jgi:aconitate hydratase
VLATSYERIHRSNLIGMGVLPLQFQPGESADAPGLTGEETYFVAGLEGAEEIPRQVVVHIKADGQVRDLTAVVRIDAPAEAAYYRHGGIRPCLLRQMFGA